MQSAATVSIVPCSSNRGDIGLPGESVSQTLVPSTLKEEVHDYLSRGGNLIGKKDAFEIAFEYSSKGDNLFDRKDPVYSRVKVETPCSLGLPYDPIKTEIVCNNEHQMSTDRSSDGKDFNIENIKTENVELNERSKDDIDNDCNNDRQVVDNTRVDIIKKETDDEEPGTCADIENGHTCRSVIEKETGVHLNTQSESDMYMVDNHSGLKSTVSKEKDMYTIENISHLNKFIGKRKINHVFTCNACKKTFNYLFCMQNHLRTHTGERPFKCDICSKDFVTRSSLNMHKLMHGGERMYICHQCGASYRQPDKLKLHLKRHSGEFDFKCDICGRTFIRKDHFKKHIQTHSKDRPYVCNECGKTFNVSNYLKDHIKRTHMHGSYKCEKCDEVYARKDNLDRHMSRKHSIIVRERFSLRMVQCEMCGVSYKSEYIKTHQKDHCKSIERKEFVCQVCKKGYITKASLKYHQRIHTGDGKITCDICDKTFYHAPSYKMHLYTHKDSKEFRCEICSKGFTNPASLRVHRQTHSSDIKYNCKDCGLGFTMKSYLHRHMLRHSLGKRFTCDFCSKEFYRIDGLKRHVKGCQKKKEKPKRGSVNRNNDWTSEEDLSYEEDNWSDMDSETAIHQRNDGSEMKQNDEKRTYIETREISLRRKRKVFNGESRIKLSDVDEKDKEREGLLEREIGKPRKKMILNHKSVSNINKHDQKEDCHNISEKRQLRKRKISNFVMKHNLE